jgi:uncharacterized protein (DUF302 family)
MPEAVTTVHVQRHTWTSTRSFDDVLADVEAGLGHPDFREESEQLRAAATWDEFQTIVAGNTGSVGLAVFLQLDLGVALAADPEAHPRRIVRIIAGNPVTMSSIVRGTPQAGASVPVTILIFEDGPVVHIQYDAVSSALGAEPLADTATRASALDAKVIELLRRSTQ